MGGSNTLAAEITHVSKHGFWLLLGEEELLLPFTEFPWFRQATIDQLTTIEWPTPDHLYPLRRKASPFMAAISGANGKAVFGFCVAVLN